MTIIPPPPAVSVEDVLRWKQLKAELDKLKWAESELRKKIFGTYFPMPNEGMNNYSLGNGWIIKATHVIDRKVDQAQLSVLQKMTVAESEHLLKAAGYSADHIGKLKPDMPILRAVGVSIDKLVEYKPELKIREFRTLTKEQEAIVNMFVDTKPGSPQVKLEPTPEMKAQLEAAAAPTAIPLPPAQ